MKSRLKNIFFLALIGILTAQTSKAGDVVVGGGGNGWNPLEKDSFIELINSLASLAMKIGIPVAGIFIIYSGLLFVTARGNEEQIKKARQNFFWTMGGTAILLGAKVIVSAISETIKNF